MAMAAARVYRPSTYQNRLLLALLLASAMSVFVYVTLWMVPWTAALNAERSQLTSSTSHLYSNHSHHEADLNKHNICDLLIRGDPAAIGQAMKVMDNYHVNHTLEDLIGGNCSDVLKDRKFIMQASEEERAFPLAFSILMYKDADQALRLLRAIYRPHNHYCVHVDVKADPKVKDAMAAAASCLPGVFMAPHPVSVEWGKFSVIEAEMVCMQALLRHPKWRYFINLTGQEFPLKTNLEMVRILKAIRGANVVEAFTNSSLWAHRWEKAGPPPPRIKIFKGPTHVGLTRQFVHFVLHDVTARAMAAWARNTTIPDETFFNTLNYSPLLHAPGGYTGPLEGDFIGGFMRYKRWRHQNQCGGKIVRQVCIFGVADLPRMTAHKALFANKLHWDFQPLALDCLEAWYHGLVEAERVGGGRALNITEYSRPVFVPHHVPSDTHPDFTPTATADSSPSQLSQAAVFPDIEDVDKSWML